MPIALLLIALVTLAAVPAVEGLLAGDPVIIAAGDISRCVDNGDEETARLIDGMQGTVLALGDLAYDTGTTQEFSNCYNPTWGRFKSRTRPVPGNHEYFSDDAAPYFAYFGAIAGPAGKGYYSFNLGAWHLIALNSNIPAGDGTPQLEWLRADLAANKRDCTLAFWHHPVFSSGLHGNDPRMADVWKVLHSAGADVILNGHDHDYERFAPQNSYALAEPDRGIREFIVGTGGGDLREFADKSPRANSEQRKNDVWGVLKMTLHPAGYSWEFVPAKGQSYHDNGTGQCVR